MTSLHGYAFVLRTQPIYSGSGSLLTRINFPHCRTLENHDFNFQSKAALFPHEEEAVLNMPMMYSLSHSPVLWSTIVMLSIVFLLVAWEQSIHHVRTTLPKPFLSFVDGMLAEVSGIGFIGLFLSVFVTGGLPGLFIADLSNRFLGDENILLESFEFLHSAFFEVGVGFFILSGLVVGAVLKEIQGISYISKMAIDLDGDGDVSMEELALAMNIEPRIIDKDGDGLISESEMVDALRNIKKDGPFLDELGMSQEERAAESMMIRERLIRKYRLSRLFQMEKYFEQVFAENLEKIVELSPMTWIPLIPFIALVNTVDMNNDLVSASSPNAVISCGEYIVSPGVLYPSILLQIISLFWGLFNFWKMASIKRMLCPTIVRCNRESDTAIFLPPRYEDEAMRKEFNSSPGFVEYVESFFVNEKSRNAHQELFGAAGGDGPELYANSIKLNLWLCVTQVILFCSEIVFRDLSALLSGSLERAGNPSGIVLEIIVFSTFVALSLANIALTPLTFLNYSYITSIESMTKDTAMRKAFASS